jgi:hypothetical protein
MFYALIYLHGAQYGQRGIFTFVVSLLANVGFEPAISEN